MLAQRIIRELESATEPPLAHDSSTNALIRRYRAAKGREILNGAAAPCAAARRSFDPRALSHRESRMQLGMIGLGPDGRQHGAPADRAAATVASSSTWSRKPCRTSSRGEGDRRVVARRFRREARQAARDLADGARRGRRQDHRGDLLPHARGGRHRDRRRQLVLRRRHPPREGARAARASITSTSARAAACGAWSAATA